MSLCLVCLNQKFHFIKNLVVNHIIQFFLDGYGSEMIGLLRKIRTGSELPLTLGRDFSGKVISKGFSPCKSKELQVGQQVWGVVPVHLQGSHAETVLVPNAVVCNILYKY